MVQFCHIQRNCIGQYNTIWHGYSRLVGLWLFLVCKLFPQDRHYHIMIRDTFSRELKLLSLCFPFHLYKWLLIIVKLLHESTPKILYHYEKNGFLYLIVFSFHYGHPIWMIQLTQEGWMRIAAIGVPKVGLSRFFSNKYLLKKYCWPKF